MAPITSDCVAAQFIRFEHGLSSALMALITSDCINGPNHLGLRRGPIHSLRTDSLRAQTRTGLFRLIACACWGCAQSEVVRAILNAIRGD